MKQPSETGKGIKSDETLFALIETLRELDGAGVTELADHLGVAKSTIHGHLTSMRDHGFVVKRGAKYHLGLGFFDYGQYVRGQLNIFRSGMEAVDELERATGEMVWLITHENGRAMYIYGRGGQNDIDINTILGKRAYMHCNSGGKAILAHLPEEEIHAIVDEHGLPPQTENTITSRDALFDELEQIRKQGYALNLSEDLKGVHAIGIPLTFEGEIQGALSIAGPAHRLSQERCEGEVFDQLQAATDEIELNLAYR